MTKQRFEVLDAWRGICAFLVMVFHLGLASHFYTWTPVRHGHYGVAFFFVLSGFVIAYTSQDRLAKGGYFRDFLARRFSRIYPLHLLTLLALVGLEVGKLVVTQGGVRAGEAPFAGASSLPALGANLLLLNGFGFFSDFTWNGPSWSIGAEFYTYILFAAVVILVGHRFAFTAALIVLASTTWMIVNAISAQPVPTIGGQGLVACILGFFTGALTLRSYLHFGPAPAWLEPFVLAGVITIFAFGAPAGLEVFLFAAFVYVFAGERGLLSRAFRRPPLLTLGALSYSIYLIHYPVLTTVNAVFRLLQSKTHAVMFGVTIGDHLLLSVGGPWAMDVLALGIIATVIGLSALCYSHFELPAERWLRARLTGGEPPQVDLPRTNGRG